VSSRRWQFDLATDCIAGRGRITVQFFDIGYSREIAWADRPEAARLSRGSRAVRRAPDNENSRRTSNLRMI